MVKMPGDYSRQRRLLLDGQVDDALARRELACHLVAEVEAARHAGDVDLLGPQKTPEEDPTLVVGKVLHGAEQCEGRLPVRKLPTEVDRLAARRDGEREGQDRDDGFHGDSHGRPVRDSLAAWSVRQVEPRP